MLLTVKWPLPIELVLVAIPFVITLIVIAAIGAAIGYCLSLLICADQTGGAGIGIWGAILGAIGRKLPQMPMKFQVVDGADPILGMPLDVFALAAIARQVIFTIAFQRLIHCAKLRAFKTLTQTYRHLPAARVRSRNLHKQSTPYASCCGHPRE